MLASITQSDQANMVRFELKPLDQGCELILTETINRVTEHTPKDLAGWHVCLDEIRAILDGESIDPREQRWEQLYEQYQQLIHQLSEG